MNPKVINPYFKLGNKHKESLDYIIANLPLNPAFEDLNNKLAESFFIPDPNDPTPLDAAEGVIKTILPHAYNGYVNSGTKDEGRVTSEGVKTSEVLKTSEVSKTGGGYWRFNESQMRLIGQMLNGINNIPVESISEFLSGIEEEIVSGKLTYEEQIPLLAAAQTGKSDHEYWMAQIATPAGWNIYLDANPVMNYLHVAGWVQASMQGALLTYGLMRPPQVQLLDILTASIGSTGLVAGKVVFKWV